MINSLWISKTGMEAQQTQLDVISNNLANVSTNGFKRANAVFEDLMYQNLRQVGSNSTEQSQLPTGLQVGLGVRTVATARSFAQGSMQQSGNSLDVAVKGNGFFQVTMPDGTIGYTRDGSFQLDSQGRLVTSAGLPIANGITIPATAQSVSISADGIVTATIPGNTAPQPIGTPGANGLGTVMQGFVETSNVNIVQELVNMIQTQRAYEMNSKAVQTSDQMLQKLSQI